MARRNSLFEFDLFLPKFTNSGKRIPASFWESLRRTLTQAFGGVTEMRYRNIGRWKMGSFVYVDELVIFRVLTSKTLRSQKLIHDLKNELRKKLSQQEILVVRRDVLLS